MEMVKLVWKVVVVHMQSGMLVSTSACERFKYINAMFEEMHKTQVLTQEYLDSDEKILSEFYRDQN